MDKRLEKAAKKMADAYRAWILANAEYNSLLGVDYPNNAYTIKWTSGTK